MKTHIFFVPAPMETVSAVFLLPMTKPPNQRSYLAPVWRFGFAQHLGSSYSMLCLSFPEILLFCK